MWMKENITLKYKLGEYVLFRRTFPFGIAQVHFLQLIGDSDGSQLPYKSIPPGVQGLLSRSHPVETKISRFKFSEKFIRYVPQHYHHYLVNLMEYSSYEHYLQKMSSKSRSTIKRKMKKFSKHCDGTIIWQEYRTLKEMEEFYALARRISKRTYQERLAGAGLPVSKNFYQAMLDLAARNSVRGYLLFLNKEPIAYLYAPIKDHIMFYAHLGYDPKYSKWSVGTILQNLIMEKLFTDKDIKYFDFTEGQADHKRFWATEDYLCADIYYFRKTTMTLFYLLVHTALYKLSRLIVFCLDQLRIKRWLKKKIRE